MRSSQIVFRLLVFLSGLTAGAQGLFGQCVSTLSYGSDTGNLIRLDGFGISDSQLNAAGDYWAACPTYGTGFARFTTDNVSTPVSVSVTYLGGVNTVCGEAQHQTPTFIQINLWSQGLTSSGDLYNCNVTDTLAHELGHALDLANSSCQGFMMGPAPLTLVNGQYTAGTRSVRGEECSTVDSLWTTSSDQEGGGGAVICI